MDLILWRHAEADGESGDGPDTDRKLTPKGEKQAERMAEWLHQRLPESTKILVSPAKRAQQTALALTGAHNRKFRTVKDLAPDSTAEAVLTAADWPESRNAVLIVGHQPTLGQVAAWLIGGEPDLWAMKKGAIWWIRQRERGGAAQNTLIAVQNPDFL
jgi:phosphohistidine phosphatase